MNSIRHSLFTATLALAAAAPAGAQSSPYRGLWVGEVLLGEVNEVTVPLDAGNVPRAPDPNVTTPTSDTAGLRLIVHVDAGGRARLLKQVAILARKADTQESESDLALVTDERLYGAFPPQPAIRISSAVFDFGDKRATAAVNEVVERAASAAASTAGQPGATQSSVASAAQAAANGAIAEADAAARFTTFLQQNLNANQVKAIAAGGSTANATAAATALEGGSFYQDGRGLAMVQAVSDALAALPAGATTAQKEKAALNAAAAIAETDAAYERFIAGESFGDMIRSAAQSLSEAASAAEPKPAVSFQSASNGAAVLVGSPAHGLVTNDEIAVFDAPVAAYNGLHKVTRIDDNAFSISKAFVAGGAIQAFSASTGIAPTRVTSPGHGLASDMMVTIRDSAGGYNGGHVITRIDENTFSIPVVFGGNPTNKGTWSNRGGAITGYAGVPVSTGDGSFTSIVKVTVPNHGLNNNDVIHIRNAGRASYNGQKRITRVDANSFTIDQAFDGNPTAKGTWDIPVGITGFQPPAGAPARIDSPAHGLATGDRIAVTGSGFAPYNGTHQVTVINANAFSIPVVFPASGGNPDTKGSWLPEGGASWRKVATLRAALASNASVNAVKTQALQTKLTAYDDTRAPDAVDVVLEAALKAAATNASPLAVQILIDAEAAGRKALSDSVKRYPAPEGVPGTDYTALVRSSGYTGSPSVAANAAAQAALKEKANLISTPQSIFDKAKAAAIEALNNLYATASRAMVTDLPMTGSFAPGAAGLTADIHLPANHPTNPFRHRRHPDHTVGIDIRRIVELDFHAHDPRPLRGSGFGVDRITGVYREEIHGLHKPLGPAGNIGLKVRGTFTLNRISHIDTLNGR